MFRVLNSKSEVSEDPFVGSAVANRLASHLRSAGIYDGETRPSFRSGRSITLSLLGVPSEDVARHVGWSSMLTAVYFSQTGKVMNSVLVAVSLAMNTVPSPIGGGGGGTTCFYAYPGFLCQKLYEEPFSSFSLTFSTC